MNKRKNNAAIRENRLPADLLFLKYEIRASNIANKDTGSISTEGLDSEKTMLPIDTSAVASISFTVRDAVMELRKNTTRKAAANKAATLVRINFTSKFFGEAISCLAAINLVYSSALIPSSTSCSAWLSASSMDIVPNIGSQPLREKAVSNIPQ